MKSQKIKIDPEIAKVLNRIRNRGYRANLIGGFVRDLALGKKSFDCDITTDAKADEILDIFKGMKLVSNYKKYGTVKLICDYYVYDITTYRMDENYKDKRHPDTVVFKNSLREDIKRRDFTINSLYIENDRIIDPFNGLNDYKRGILKSVGNSEKRIKEDALRSVRAIRFCASLGLRLDDKLKEAIRNHTDLSLVSQERINLEIMKMLKSPYALKAIEEAFDTDLFSKIFFEPEKVYGKKEEYIKITKKLLKKRYLNEVCILAIIFRNLNDPLKKDFLNDAFEKVVEKKSLKKEIKSLIKEVWANHKKEDVKYIWYHRGFNHLISLLQIEKAKNEISGVKDESFKKIKLYLKNQTMNDIYRMKVDGYDLINAGFKKEKIGLVKNKLIEGIIDGKLKNEKKLLLEYAKELKSIE